MKKYYRLYSSLPQNERHLTCAEIDLGALAHNYRTLRARFSANSAPRIIAVVKADAYGHGSPACVRTLLGEGCDFFAVSCIDEAVTVRAACKEAHARADILILGYTPPTLATELARFDLIQTLLSEDYALALNDAALAAKVTLRTHVAVDTGMHRIGFAAYGDGEILASAEAILRASRLSHLTLEGMFTHFSRADEIAPLAAPPENNTPAAPTEGAEFTALQALRYRRLRAEIEARGVTIPFHHTCNSAASLLSPSEHFDGVRPGILLYGVLPVASDLPPLLPVLKLRTAVMHLHTLPAGECVGYGGTFCADTPRRIATLPIGYADGLLRAYSGALVTVEGKHGSFRAPIVGRICMDQCMIDVTGQEVAVGDGVTLFGNDPSELSELAARAETIEYECLCLLSSRVPRAYTQSTTSEESSV